MRNYKGFIIFTIKLIVVIGAAVGGYWLLYWFLWISPLCPNAYNQSFQHALYRQYEALKDENRDNELIVFGASYVPFGLDVEVAEKVTGMKTQTLGVEGDMGTKILVDIIRKTAKPGDVVCYVLGKSNSSYEDYIAVSCAFESDKEVLLDYFNSRKEMEKNYRTTMMWRKMYALLAAGLVEDVRSSISSKKQVYALSSFDEKGNMIIDREGTLFDINSVSPEILSFDTVDTKMMDIINDLSDWCDENDITFVIVYGMFMNEAITQSNEEINQYDMDVRDYMRSPVIMTPEEGFMDGNYFYNHVYHLNSEGAKIYSEIIGNDVVNYLNNRGND